MSGGLSDAFFAKLAALGERHTTDPVVYLDVWNAESNLNPTAENGRSHARGLNQMMPATLAHLGAPAAFNALPAEAQLPWIEQLINDGEQLNAGPFRSAERYFHANFFPRTLPRGQTPTAVVVASDAADPLERSAYAANAGMDPISKGRITYADLTAFLNRAKNGNRLTYAAARARLALAMRGTTPATAAAATVGPLALLGVGLVAAFAWRAR